MLPGSITGLNDPLPPFTCHKKSALCQHHFTQQCGKVTFLSIPIANWLSFFLQGLIKGFCIGFDYASTITLKSAKSNMESIHFHAEVVDEYLQTGISLGHVAGPFPPDAIPDCHVSRYGVIP